MSTSRGGEWGVPITIHEEDMDNSSEGDDMDDMDDAPPVHPVPTMQGAFEESMDETLNETDDPEPDRYSKADSQTRRKMLLEQEQYERTVAGRWKQKPGEKFHPLWKLVAQISFGVHLLQQGLAKSDDEVLKILQTHVDEVDGFLERTTEDFDLGQGDIDERIRYLKLPLEHGHVFDQMLADKNFRVAIVEGNEKIEHIIDRTAAAMNDALKDVQKGLDATRELAKYMTRVDKQWDDRTEDHDSVYLAMIGNTEGWTRAFLTLQSKGGHLRKALVQLGSIVAEMQRRAGAASRKNLMPSRSFNDRYNVESRSESPQISATPPRSPMKPLPNAPDPAARIASSQKFIITSVSKSPTLSPFANRSTPDLRQPIQKYESSISSRSPNLVMPSTRTDPGRSARTPTPDMSSGSFELTRPERTPNLGVNTKNLEPVKSARSPEPSRSNLSPEPMRSTRSPTPTRSNLSPEPARSARSPEPTQTNPSLEPARSTKSPETTRSNPSPEPIRIARSPEPIRFNLSPEPPRSTKSSEPVSMNLPGRSACSPEFGASKEISELARPARSPEPVRSAISPSPMAANTTEPESHANSSDPVLTFRTPAEVMAQMREASCTPSIPQRPASRRKSLTERTLSLLGRRNSVRENNTKAQSGTIVSMKEPSSNHGSPLKNPSSPISVPTRKSSYKSSRKSHAFSMSTYSTSPTSPNRPISNPQSSPVFTRSGEPVPRQSEYNHLSLLPMHNFSSSLDNLADSLNLITRLDSPGKWQRPQIPIMPSIASLSKPETVPDDSEGNVNTAHPLLKEARHTRFAKGTMPGTPRGKTPRDLSLRHYQSQDALSSKSNTGLSVPELEDMITPNRSSSLLYDPAQNAVNESPASQQISRKPSKLDILTRATTAPLIGDLGVHPAHRNPDPASASISLTSPDPDPSVASTSSSATGESSTPPPIATNRPSSSGKSTIKAASPLRRLAPAPPPQLQTQPENLPPPTSHPDSGNMSATKQTPNIVQYKATVPSQPPFYLNPVSSTALVDSLASTPPPSPLLAHPGTPLQPGTPASNSTIAFFNRPYNMGDASPPPPGPGGSRFPPLPIQHTVNGDVKRGTTSASGAEKKAGWKKVFGGGKGTKERGFRGGFSARGKKGKLSGNMDVEAVMNGVGPPGGEGGEPHPGAFMGVGKDGVWISKKNFLKA